MNPAIEICDFEKSYGKALVFNRLNLEVRRSELLVILGESGSGKSTLLRLIAGLEKPHSGTLRIAGVDQSRVQPHQRDVAIVFQDGNGYGHLTVRQNLDLAAKSSSQIDQVTRWVDSLKLGSTLNQKLSQLSGGQSQRVAIARAMLSGKSILLLDEPLAHLNQSLREEIRELICNVHQETERTIVYVTHDSDDAFYLATRVAALHAGQIQQTGDPRSVFCTPRSRVVAQLLGQPTLDVVHLPTEWFDGKWDSKNAVLESGIRSHDWTIEHVQADSLAERPNELGFSLKAETLHMKGALVGCHWMGDHWLLEVDCPQRVRITCASPTPNWLEQSLSTILDELRSKRRSKHLGYVEARVDRSRIRAWAPSIQA